MYRCRPTRNIVVHRCIVAGLLKMVGILSGALKECLEFMGGPTRVRNYHRKMHVRWTWGWVEFHWYNFRLSVPPTLSDTSHPSPPRHHQDELRGDTLKVNQGELYLGHRQISMQWDVIWCSNILSFLWSLLKFCFFNHCTDRNGKYLRKQPVECGMEGSTYFLLRTFSL